ncbi:MAG: endolytic transglycosylase MltG [Clostridia bacterium]|nr:endolytic transglycosylase MltG [Clostridia bacterium]
MSNKKNKRRIILSVISIALILLIILIWKVVGVFVEYFSDDPYDGKTVYITVEQGDTIDDVAKKLKKVGVIESETGFIYKYKFNREDYGQIQYFEEPFYIYKGDTTHDILRKLTKADPVDLITVTVPEGFSVDMIALRMSNNGLCTVDEFVAAVKDTGYYDYELIKYIPEGNYKYKLEGFLFPSTYTFEAGVTAYEIVDEMLGKFCEEYAAVYNSYDNVFQIMTIASMVEREAALDSERATISGVIANRIAIDMNLQIDATAVYAESNGLYDIENVNAETVKVDSPYNTYINKGLPPGPICNPGIKSIVASGNPEAHNYLYYHTDTDKNDGSHIFTQTYEEHASTIK